MKKLEMREMLIVRCDVCGSECTGSYVSFNIGTPNEQHACAGWNEALQQRCEDKLRKNMAECARGVSASDGQTFSHTDADPQQGASK
jgi:hypothetical protein